MRDEGMKMVWGCAGEVQVNVEACKLVLSKIFQWYGKDFGSKADLVALLVRHMPTEQKKQLEGLLASASAEELKFEFKPYDWSQNSK